MKLAQCLLVKNEEDIIKYNISYHKNIADVIIVTDNNSDDKTREILESLYQKQVIDELIIEKDNNYNQYVWNNRMSLLAKHKYNCTHCFCCDADEFWDIDREQLESGFLVSDIIKIPFHNYFPEVNKHFTEFKYRTTGKEYSSELLSKIYNLFNAVNSCEANKYKAIYSLSNFVSNWQGNHGVDLSLDCYPLISKEMIIRHYPILSYDRFKNKIIQGGTAYNNNKEFNKNIGSHWRLLYNIYLQSENLFKEEYSKITHIDKDKLIDDNVIIRDELNRYL